MGVFVMQNKTTNFCINKKIKFWLLFFLFVVTQSTILSEYKYKMSLEAVEIINDTTIEACVYIENQDQQLELTSYQCALSINQNIDLSKLQLFYIDGSSELLNEPNLYIGIDNIDGPTELTFVSYIGHDIITKKTLVGKFRLIGGVEISEISLLGIKWDFEGTISTIITGDNFENITNPLNHTSVLSLFVEQYDIDKIEIVSSEASDVFGEKFTDKMLYDGIDSKTNNNNSPSSDGRWAVSGFPQWVTIDLGEETYIDHVKLDPYGSEEGISYDCEFYYGKYDERTYLKKETTSVGQQWSTHNLNGITSRYLTVIVTGSIGNTWTDIWEIEIYGFNSTTDLNEENEHVDSQIPDEYSISQNYPNPFNPSTKVEIKMKENGNARLNLFNILGEKVATVINEELSAGIHVVDINGSNLSSGTYLYQLIVNNEFSIVKKMKLMK